MSDVIITPEQALRLAHIMQIARYPRIEPTGEPRDSTGLDTPPRVLTRNIVLDGSFASGLEVRIQTMLMRGVTVYINEAGDLLNTDGHHIRLAWREDPRWPSVMWALCEEVYDGINEEPLPASQQLALHIMRAPSLDSFLTEPYTGALQELARHVGLESFGIGGKGGDR